jgi:protein transport protein SEC23
VVLASSAVALACCFVVQTGLFEMKEMVQLTGGQCVQIDSFTNLVFKDSLKRMFARYV